MKKLIALVIVFILYTISIKTCPVITEWDKSVIIFVQGLLNILPVTIPLLADCILYWIMIFIPIVLSYVWGLKVKNFTPAIAMTVVPLIAYMSKFILKPIFQRPRPPMDLQIAVHPHSFSYVSTHSLLTFTVWGLVIYFLCKYCENKYLKYAGILFAALWILFVGLSRVWRIFVGVYFNNDLF